MSRRTLAALAALTLVLPRVAQAQTWSVLSRRDPLTGNQRTSAHLSPAEVAGSPGVRPTLIVRCSEDGDLDAYISTDRVLDSYEYESLVRLRWDNEPIAEEGWTIGDGMTSVFARHPREFLLQTLKRKRLAVRLPVYSAGYTTAVFRIPPLPARVMSAVERQCKFPNASERAAAAAREVAEEREAREALRAYAEKVRQDSVEDRQREVRDSLDAIPGRLADAACRAEREVFVRQRDSTRRAVDPTNKGKVSSIDDIIAFDFYGCKDRVLPGIRDSLAKVPKPAPARTVRP